MRRRRWRFPFPSQGVEGDTGRSKGGGERGGVRFNCNNGVESADKACQAHSRGGKGFSCNKGCGNRFSQIYCDACIGEERVERSAISPLFFVTGSTREGEGRETKPPPHPVGEEGTRIRNDLY